MFKSCITSITISTVCIHFVCWVIGIVILIWIFATLFNIPGKQRKRKKDTSIGILKRRFANGEITKEEFEEKKKILQ